MKLDIITRELKSHDLDRLRIKEDRLFWKQLRDTPTIIHKTSNR